MKGFKPSGYGPSAGFKFPASYGFTGSTGAYTNVQPYVRMKPRAFKDGGYVSEKVGDAGHALVQRDRPYTNEDQQSGGKTPLRRGFKKGGKAHRAMKKAKGGAVRAMPGALSAADVGMLRKSVPSRDMSAGEIGSMLRKAMPKRPTMPAAGMKGKFAAADGGKVEYEKPTYSQALADRVKEMLGMAGRSSTGLAKRAADRIEERQSKIDSAVDSAVSGKSNYAKGGMAKAAKSAVMKHVNTPAPKGHKGLGALCK